MTLPAANPAHFDDIDFAEHRAVERLLFTEAQLLDERNYLEWVDLWSDDLDYIVVGPAVPSPTSAVDDRPGREFLDRADLPYTVLNRTTMTMRVQRLLSGRALNELPPPPTVRMITNIDVQRHPHDDDRLTVRSNFLLYRSGELDQVMLAGSRRDTLRRDGQRLMLAHRIVSICGGAYPTSVIPV